MIIKILQILNSYEVYDWRVRNNQNVFVLKFGKWIPGKTVLSKMPVIFPYRSKKCINNIFYHQEIGIFNSLVLQGWQLNFNLGLRAFILKKCHTQLAGQCGCAVTLMQIWSVKVKALSLLNIIWYDYIFLS